MKKFKLLKDLPGVKAGAVFHGQAANFAESWFEYIPMHLCPSQIGQHMKFTDAYIEKCPDFFEEIRERWEPKIGEYFWTVSWDLGVCKNEWGGFMADIIAMKAGNCFRTCEQAEAAAKEVRAALEKYHERIGE